MIHLMESPSSILKTVHFIFEKKGTVEVISRRIKDERRSKGEGRNSGPFRQYPIYY